MRSPSLAYLVAAVLLWPAYAGAAEKKKTTCIYQTAPGKYLQAPSIDDVPREFRARARCFTDKQDTYLARPQDITLEGNVRTEDVTSSLGRVKLRWPRTVEVLFGRTPLRAVTDAATTVSRAVKTAAFPSHVQTLDVEWQIVFMDERMPGAQVPSRLISNCHPGWMTPPANIYIVAQRIAEGCGGGANKLRAADADAVLTRVLLHEMGHVLEYHLLKKNMSMDRMRAEGFATWFETYSAQYSSIVNARALRREINATAKLSLDHSPNSFVFQGSPIDYARASLYFAAIVDRRGVRGLMEVYDSIAEDGLGFFDAIKKRVYWDAEQLQKEVLKAAAGS